MPGVKYLWRRVRWAVARRSPEGARLGTAVPPKRGAAVLSRALTAWTAISGLAFAVPPPPAPTHRELWVPEKSVASALKTMPKSVVLTREQFQTLLRDSTPPNAADPRIPPAVAILRSARYSGSLGEKAALLHAEFVVETLGETWAELPITLDPHWLGSVTVDGTTAVSATDQAALLIVRGIGTHLVKMDFAVPLTESAGSRTLTLRAPGAAEATLVLTAPDALKLESALPFTRTAGTATFALPPGHDEFRVSWTARDVPPLETAGIFQDSRFVYTLDAAQIRADLSLLFHAALKNLPNALALPVSAGTQVLAVEGTELARWSLAGDQLLAEFQPGERRETDVHVLLSLPVAEAAATLELPAPVAAGIHRASGSFSLLSHPGLRVRRVITGALTVRDDTQAPAEMTARSDYRGTWAFPVLVAAPAVEIERLTSRFTATLDTQITLARDAIHLTRHLAFLPRDGTLFSPRVTGLLAGEEIDSVKLADNCDAVWQPIEGGLALATPAGTAPGQSLTVVIASTLHPAGWNQLGDRSFPLTVTSAQLPGAEKVSGYLALDFDESLRVTTPKTDGLEPRDPRQFEGKLPLTGRRAWFRLDAFQLDLAVSRRPPEFDAAVALDVLPLLNTLEIEGQLTLALDHGGLRELVVTFPATAAEAIRWESPLLAEKTLGADGKWTLKFHQETTGTPQLRFHASLPLTDKSTAGEPERRFAAQVPFPVVDSARRTEGTLVVEANSDTELTFGAQALDDLDTRRAPAIEGYAPRHRLVAGYTWRGNAATLAIDGVRHQAGDLAGTVIDSLTLDSVVSADGPQRHQAILAVRTAGAQFLDLNLPKSAEVLSVVINGIAAKPIRGPKGALRLPLPDHQVRLQLIYQLPDAKLRDLSQTTLPPLTLDPRLPVLDTTWRLHLPEGFTYSQFDSNLTEKDAPPPAPSLANVLSTQIEKSLIGPNRNVASMLIEIEPTSAVPGGIFSDNNVQTKASPSEDTFLPTARYLMTSADNLLPVVKKLDLAGRWGFKNEDDAIERLRQMTEVDQERGTDLIRLSVRARSSQEAAELAENITQSYAERRTKLESDRINYAFTALTQSRKGQELAVEQARSKMLESARNLGIVDVDGDALATIQKLRDEAKSISGDGLSKSGRFRQAADDYNLQSEILQTMVTEQEKARLLNLMPRSPVTVHQHATAGDETARTTLSFAAPEAAPPTSVEALVSPPGQVAAGFGEGDKPNAANGFMDIDAPVAPPTLDATSGIINPIADPRVPSGGLKFGNALFSQSTTKFSTAQQQAGADKNRAAMRAGLLPLEFSLPEGGRTYTFAGKFAPTALSFRAEAWEQQVRLAWLWMVIGGLVFAVLMRLRRRPIFVGLLGGLTLHFAPFIAERPDWTPIANALLTGWLVAVGIVLLAGLARWASRKDANTREVAHA